MGGEFGGGSAGTPSSLLGFVSIIIAVAVAVDTVVVAVVAVVATTNSSLASFTKWTSPSTDSTRIQTGEESGEVAFLDSLLPFRSEALADDGIVIVVDVDVDNDADGNVVVTRVI